MDAGPFSLLQGSGWAFPGVSRDVAGEAASGGRRRLLQPVEGDAEVLTGGDAGSDGWLAWVKVGRAAFTRYKYGITSPASFVPHSFRWRHPDGLPRHGHELPVPRLGKHGRYYCWGIGVCCRVGADWVGTHL